MSTNRYETFAARAIGFHTALHYDGPALPAGVSIMNPFREIPQVVPIITEFYNKYFNDRLSRHLLLGINPGRYGGGLTGIPFTDPKRLESVCGIGYSGPLTHEVSSVFIYEMIDAYGGPTAFYRDLYINSPCPLGFKSIDSNGREKNYNYYDSPQLMNAVLPFMVKSTKELISLGVATDVCFLLGTGKNEKFIRKLNDQHGFFQKLVPLEHPRYIMQYKSRTRHFYIDKYLKAFEEVKR